jgi:hypothetical protein
MAWDGHRITEILLHMHMRNKRWIAKYLLIPLSMSYSTRVLLDVNYIFWP